jgi:hypothetical protein
MEASHVLSLCFHCRPDFVLKILLKPEECTMSMVDFQAGSDLACSLVRQS